MKRGESYFGNVFSKKMFALLKIAIVLCSVFLVALPVTGIAADSEGNFVLEIYGNANEDDTIDMRDYTYTARIICWLEEETTFADANYDGRISVADMTQIGLIILGRESELTIVDSADRIVTVQKPVDRIVVATTSNGEAIQILKATDRVVGISDHSTLPSPICFPKLSQLPSIGATGYYGPPDYERILSLNTDLVLDYAWQDHYTIFTDKLPESIPVVGFDFINDATIAEEFEKLGYILDKEDEAKEFIDFYEGYVDTMKKRTEELSGDEKPRVYVGFADYDLYVTISSLDQWYQPLLDMAGGMNMAADLAEDSWGSWWGTGGLYPKVDPEWVIEQNPDIILGGAGWGPTKGGYTTDDPLEMKELRDDIISLPELAGLEAVKNGEVYAIHFDLLCGPSFFIAALYYGTWFHPELFGDLDPQATLQEYVDFRGIDFDVYVQGVFVYPPLE